MDAGEFSREKYSKAMFGTKDALDVFGVVIGFDADPPKIFTASDIRQEFLDPNAINNSSIKRNLAKLEGIGAIQRISAEGNPASYQRMDSIFWEGLVKSMVDTMIERSLER